MDNFTRSLKLDPRDTKKCALTFFRGIRQGCPLSAILFVFAVKILACRMRTDNNLKGINENTQPYNKQINR